MGWRHRASCAGSLTSTHFDVRRFIYVRLAAKTFRIPALSWNSAERAWDILEEPAEGESVIWPIDEKGQDRVWSLNHISAVENIGELEIRLGRNGVPQVYRKHRPAEGVLPRSWWDKKTYAAREYGSAMLTQLFGSAPFSFAKSPYAVQDSLWVSGLGSESDRQVLDFFAGSGTTGHAVINLNREDGGQRKFILVEMGDYFDTVLLPRIKKVTFAPEWKDGKPKRFATPEEAERSPRIVKVVRLESYEDALNNGSPDIKVGRSPGRSDQELCDLGRNRLIHGFFWDLPEQYFLASVDGRLRRPRSGWGACSAAAKSRRKVLNLWLLLDDRWAGDTAQVEPVR